MRIGASVFPILQFAIMATLLLTSSFEVVNRIGTFLFLKLVEVIFSHVVIGGSSNNVRGLGRGGGVMYGIGVLYFCFCTKDAMISVKFA